MIQENEILALALGIGILILIVVNWADFNRRPSTGLLLTAFAQLLLARLFSVLEGLFWSEFFNLAEHGFYLLSAICLTVWTVRRPRHHHAERP